MKRGGMEPRVVVARIKAHMDQHTRFLRMLRYCSMICAGAIIAALASVVAYHRVSLAAIVAIISGTAALIWMAIVRAFMK